MGGPIWCHVNQFCLVVAIAMPMLLIDLKIYEIEFGLKILT